MFDKLREILFNLISLTNARHIRGKAKYNAIGRLINEIEDICMYTDWEDKSSSNTRTSCRGYEVRWIQIK